MTIDVESGYIFAEANSADAWHTTSFSTENTEEGPSRLLQSGSTLPKFDQTTKLYLCSYKGGTWPHSCTVSRLQLVSMYDKDQYNHLGDFSRTLIL